MAALLNFIKREREKKGKLQLVLLSITQMHVHTTVTIVKLLSTIIIFATIWVTVVAWPKNGQADNQLLENILQNFESESFKNKDEFESEAIKNEGEFQN